MATNTLLTSQIITNELLRRFKNNLAFAGTIRHEYDDRFAQKGGKIGDTINARVPVKFTSTNGASISLQDVTEKKVPITINTQEHVAFSFGSSDLTLSIDQFGQRYLESAALALANKVDVDGLTLAYQGTHNVVGTPGTTPTALKTYLQAGAWLDDSACPVDDRCVCLNPWMQVEIVDALKGLYQDSKEIATQYVKGRMGLAAGLSWMMDQNVRSHTVGPLGGTPAVAGASQTGSSVTTDGWTAAAAARLKKGDVIQFAGVYAVNPVSGDTLQKLANFTVTADVSSAADGTATVPISPEIIVTGPYKTCSASPGNGALISVWSKAAADQGALAGTVSPQGLAYHREAFGLAMVPMDMPQGTHLASRSTDKETGMSIRIVSDYDITEDQFITRCDILYGWAVLIPQFACRVAA